VHGDSTTAACPAEPAQSPVLSRRLEKTEDIGLPLALPAYSERMPSDRVRGLTAFASLRLLSSPCLRGESETNIGQHHFGGDGCTLATK
jgi:hypothetical protein